MIIYRLENAQGDGPVSAYNCPFKMNIRHHEEPFDLAAKNKCSISIEELNNKLSCSDFRFAWGTVEKMIKFVKYPKSVDDTDWRVVIYEVTEYVTFDDGQIMFNHTKAQVIGGCMYLTLIDDYMNLR